LVIHKTQNRATSVGNTTISPQNHAQTRAAQENSKNLLTRSCLFRCRYNRKSKKKKMFPLHKTKVSGFLSGSSRLYLTTLS